MVNDRLDELFAREELEMESKTDKENMAFGGRQFKDKN